MTEEWVWLWFRCLKLNAAYRAFCEAKRAGDQKTIRALARKHPHIRDVYADFGDIHAFNAKAQKRNGFFEWYAVRRELFETVERTEGRRNMTISPAYTLNFKQRAGHKQLQTVKRCLNVWLKLEPLPGVEKPTIPELVNLFTDHKLGDPAMWSNWSTAKMELLGNKTDLERQIYHYRKLGQTMIDRTVDGLFPAYK